MKVPSIASNHSRGDLPITLATLMGLLTRLCFCIVASTILVNDDLIEETKASYCLIGAIVYLLVLAMPEIVDQ